jgi:hypothetical protein
MVLAFGYYLMASTPAARADGRQQVLPAQLCRLARWPWRCATNCGRCRARVLAGNFKVGAELGFQLGNGDIEVLPHPLNDKHGRTAQLAQWDLLHEGPRSAPMLLVLSPSDQRYRDLLARYPPSADRWGRCRRHAWSAAIMVSSASCCSGCRCSAQGPCVTPAMAWLDAPSNGEKVSGTLAIKGWAFKDGVGLARIEVLVDGRSIGDALRAHVRHPPHLAGQHRSATSGGGLRRIAGYHHAGARAALAWPAPARPRRQRGAWQEQPFEVR